MFKRKSSTSKGRRATEAQPSKNKAVFSYYQNRDVEFDASRNRDKPPLLVHIRRRLRHLPTLVASVVILISLLWMLSLTPQPKITVVNEDNAISTAVLRPTSEYQQAAQKLLQQSLLTRNKLTLDTGDIEASLQQQFSEITNVAVVIPLVSRKPVIYIQVAEPILLLENGSKQFVIDEKGRAVISADQAGDLSGLNLIPVKDSAPLSISSGDQVLTSNETEFMKTVRDQLELKGEKVARMELPASAGDIYVFIEGKPYYVKFTTTGDALQQIGTYFSLEKELAGKSITPGEYIDVRVDERAYYK